jgi:DNA replication and repair protein RecF
MIVKNVVLKDFRNHKKTNILLHPSINFITGPNGSGKSNILEGLSVISGLKSFRHAQDIDMILWESSGYFLSTSILDITEMILEVSCIIREGKVKKQFKIEGSVIQRAVDFFGSLLTVVFSPEDITIIHGTPEIRRRYFDSVICKTDKDYLLHLIEYKRILTSRNSILRSMKDGKVMKTDLDIWTLMMAEKIEYIVSKRSIFSEYFNNEFKKEYDAISGIEESPEIEYVSRFTGKNGRDICNQIDSVIDRDIRAGATSIGPHREDFCFKNCDDRMFTGYASQGQKRTAAISLKNAEKVYTENKTGKKPVLLIDDIFSELDAKRKSNMIESILGNNQIIMTMVSIDPAVRGAFENSDVFETMDGEVSAV